jgi:hypothetical protein
VLSFGVQVDIRPVGAGGPSSMSDAAVARYVAKYATKSTESAGADLQPLSCRACAGSGRIRFDLEHARDRFCPVCHGHGRRGGASVLDDADLTAHARRLVETCWQLGGLPGLEELRLRRWAHMLGFRGHFATKSRAYSVTFTVLRERRALFTTLLHHVSLGLPLGPDEVLVVGDWRYAGRGLAELDESASPAPVSAMSDDSGGAVAGNG